MSYKRGRSRNPIFTFLLLLLAFIACLFPTELYLFVQFVLKPHGFGQQFALNTLWLLGFAQFFLLVVLFIIVSAIAAIATTEQ